MRRPPPRRCARSGGRFPLLLYLGAIALITAVLTAGLLATAHGDGVAGRLLAGARQSCSLLAPASWRVALVNWLATLLVTPRPLPRMDFSAGIPPESRTLVVVPTMLTSADGIEDLVEALEVRFLANRDDNLHFGLLTDFRDAPAETLPEDEPLLRLAPDGIEALNAKYRARPAATAAGTPSSSSTARAAGIRRSGSGWATSASAASSRT